MRNGFTLLEVLLAAIILGLGLGGILVSMSQCRRMMLSTQELETVQEVFDLGEIAYPLENVKDEDGLDVSEQRVDDLWDLVSKERMSNTQRDKYHGYTWEREAVDKNMNDDDRKRLGNIYKVRITVTWGERGRGSGLKQQESYVTFWRKPDD